MLARERGVFGAKNIAFTMLKTKKIIVIIIIVMF